MGGCIRDLAGPAEPEAPVKADVILAPEEWNRNRRRVPSVWSWHGRLAQFDGPTGVPAFLSRLVRLNGQISKALLPDLIAFLLLRFTHEVQRASLIP